MLSSLSKRRLNRDVAVAVVAGNNPDTVSASIATYYDQIERILVTADLERTWSQTESLASETLERIREIDGDKRIEIITGRFHSETEPLRNDTNQRQFMSNWFKDERTLRWVLQVDCDEIFLDLRALLSQLKHARCAEQLRAHWISAFNWAEDGRVLMVVDESGSLALESFPLAHRPGAELLRCRQIRSRENFLGKFFPSIRVAPQDPGLSVLHLSYARREVFIKEKLESWGHSTEIDGERFLGVWHQSRTEWREIRDFHPLDPPRWPALRAYSISDLCKATGSPVPRMVLTDDVRAGLRDG
jgi:hypothetical protein